MIKTPKEIIIFTECHWFSGFARNAGTYRIATELRTAGYSVQVIDFFGFMNLADIQQIRDKFIDENTLAICFSSTFYNKSSDEKFFDVDCSTISRVVDRIEVMKSQDDRSRMRKDFPFSDDVIFEMISSFKQICPNLKTVYGGSKAQNQQAKFIDCFVVDFGEKAIIDYIGRVKSDRELGTNTVGDKEVLRFDKINDDFQFSESTIRYEDSDIILQNEVLPIEVSRGCIFKCAFCSYLLMGKKSLDHVKNVDVLYGELMRNYERSGTTKYIFCDDTFNDSTQKLELLAKMVDRLPFELSFSGYIRPDLTANNPEQLDLLRHIGLRFAKMGIESLNSETRKAIGKGTSFERILKCLSDIRARWGDEVITSGSFVFGLPKETRESILFQEQWLEHEALNFLHCVSVLPLGINFSDLDTVNKSDISENYTQYGYQRIGDGAWFNPETGFTFDEMKEMTRRLYTKIHEDPRCRHGGFSGSLIQNSGITYEQIRDNHFSKLDYSHAQRVYAGKIDEYKTRLFTLEH